MGTPGSDKRRLADRTWTELDDGARHVLLVPVGSCEQHGPHLPLDTDARIAVALAEAVAAQRDDVLVAPAVAYGSSGEHAGFPGTLSIGSEVLTALLVELGRSAFPPGGPEPHRALLVVNGHGGNAEPVADAVARLQAEGRPVASWSPRIPGGDAHAGRTETSLLLVLAPEVVRPSRPVGATEPIAGLWPRLRAEGVAAISPNGVLGDASEASSAEGVRLRDRLVADLSEAIDALTSGS